MRTESEIRERIGEHEEAITAAGNTLNGTLLLYDEMKPWIEKVIELRKQRINELKWVLSNEKRTRAYAENESIPDEVD